VHIEDACVRVLVIKRGRVRAWHREDLDSGVLRDGSVVDPAALAEITRRVVADRGGNRRKLVVALSGHRTITRLLEFPEMSARMLSRAVPREVKRQIGMPLEDLRLSWQVVDRSEGHIRVFALGVPRDILDSHVHAMRRSGGTPRSMDVKPLALVRAVNRAEAIIVDLEQDALSLVIVRHGVPEAIRTVGFRPDETDPARKVERAGDELMRTLRFYNDTHPDEPLSQHVRAYLTGSLAGAVAISNIVERTTGHTVEPLTLDLQFPARFPLPAFMVNIGLSLKEA
jgi:type IV pilus assembly protein PilM